MSSIQSFYFVGVITLVSSAHVYGQKKDKMNVLFIIADDMRPELGCYGIEDIVTPHIDRLAEQATVFQNAYCNIPVSGASRASLFTGVPRHFRFRSVLRKTDIMLFPMEKFSII